MSKSLLTGESMATKCLQVGIFAKKKSDALNWLIQCPFQSQTQTKAFLMMNS